MTKYIVKSYEAIMKDAFLIDIKYKDDKIAKLIADNDLLELENSKLIDENVYLEDKAREILSCNNEGYDEWDACNYVEREECDCAVCLKEENNKLIIREKELEEACDERDDLIKKILIGKLEDGDLPSRYLEDVRCMYDKDIRDMEARHAKSIGRYQKKEADSFEKNTLLRSEVRLLKKRGEKLNSSPSDEQMKLTDALRIEVMSKKALNPMRQSVKEDFYKALGSYGKHDPWVKLLDVFNKDKFSALPFEKVISEIDIEEGFDVKINRNFTSNCYFLDIIFTSV